MVVIFPNCMLGEPQTASLGHPCIWNAWFYHDCESVSTIVTVSAHNLFDSGQTTIFVAVFIMPQFPRVARPPRLWQCLPHTRFDSGYTTTLATVLIQPNLIVARPSRLWKCPSNYYSDNTNRILTMPVPLKIWQSKDHHTCDSDHSITDLTVSAYFW